MPDNKLSENDFRALLTALHVPTQLNGAFIYKAYGDALEGAGSLQEENPLIGGIPINPVQLTLYLANEHLFYLESHPDVKEADIIGKDDYEQFLLSVALDKYYTNEHLAFRRGSYANRFLPEISTISLYLNFIQGMLTRYKQGDPNETLVVDILSKGFSMARCIVGLLTEGFETEAFSTWRTLHENECILAVLVRHGKPAIDAYLVHLRYALAFRGALGTKEETDAAFMAIKEGMRSLGLKSKDMKRYIEYGWLLAVPDVQKLEGFKLNFRDGVERVAGLRQYAKVYEMSSEIAHSSPLLIYSRKNYFYLITMLNLYESFFRLEKIFSSLYLSTVPSEEQTRYLAMQKLYFSELKACYDLENRRFQELTSHASSPAPSAAEADSED